MRKGNLEFGKCTYIGEEPEYVRYEIRNWEPNPYYGREHLYIKEGDYYIQKDNKYDYVRIHKNCFKNHELCYSIGFFIYNENTNEYEFSFCGERPLYESVEWDLFREIIKYGFFKLNHEVNCSNL